MTALTSTSAAPSFWDRIAPKYAKQPIKDPVAYEAKLARVRELLKPEDRVLEMGCGTGGTALKLAPGVAHITGTDGSAGMITIAYKRLRKALTSNVTFSVADATDIVDGGPFDAICAFSLLHLVSDVPLVVRRAHEQLKPGGLFISKTVALKEGNVVLRAFVKVLMAIGVAPKVVFLSTEDLKRTLRQAGFDIEETGYFTKAKTNPFIVARKRVAADH